MSPKRLLSLSVLLFLAASTGAPYAHAAQADRLEVAELTETSAELLLSEGQPGGFARLDRSSLRATVDGAPVEVAVENAAAQGAGRSVVLLLDVSGSMAGERIRAATAAAHDFVDQVPPDVQVGLTTFGADVKVLVPPGKDRAAVQRALAAVRAAGRTRLHDALAATAGLPGTGGGLLLLSDGADDGSTTTREQAVQAVVRDGLQLTALDLQGDATTRAALQPLVSAAGGSLVPATSAAAISAMLRQEAQRLQSQLRLSFALPFSLTGRTATAEVVATAADRRVHARVTLGAGAEPGRIAAGSAAGNAASVSGSSAGGGSSTDGSEALALIGSAPGTGAPLEGDAARPTRNRPVVLWAMATTFSALGLFAAVGFGFGFGGRDGRRSVALLAQYTVNRAGSIGAPALLERSVVAQRALRGASDMLRRRGREDALLQLLQAAGSRLQPSEWLLTRAGCAVAGVAVLGLVAGWPGAFLGLLLGLLAPKAWLKRRAKSRRTAFADGLPDALALVVGGLSSGYSFAQALDTVVREGAEPIASEIGRALAESRLGVPLEQCLEATADRMESEDLRWVVMAVTVQREVGGSLAEVLHTVFETMRDRARIRREILTLSAEGRVSAAMLVGLPIFMACYQLLFRRDYMRPMYTEPAGFVMLAIVAVALTLGTLWTRSLVKVDV